MKITNDLNNNTDFLSNLNKEDNNNSLLGSIFSITTNNNDSKSNNLSDDFEFIFKDEEIKIIEYLYNILPNLDLNYFDTNGLKTIKDEIKLDKNIDSEMKNKIISFLDSVKYYEKSFSIKSPEHDNIKIYQTKI